MKMQMKWPFILRSRHEAIKTALIANLDVRAELIGVLKKVIKTRDAEIALLKLTLEAKKWNDYTPEAVEKKKMAEPVLSGRSGWRTRAQMMSEATIPAPKDSAEALKAKVLKEGGTV
jgi:hypothetical protein